MVTLANGPYPRHVLVSTLTLVASPIPTVRWILPTIVVPPRKRMVPTNVISVTPPISRRFRAEQLLNAELPMLVASGRLIELRAVQPENA